jgi:hypothetical protein
MALLFIFHHYNLFLLVLYVECLMEFGTWVLVRLRLFFLVRIRARQAFLILEVFLLVL